MSSIAVPSPPFLAWLNLFRSSSGNYLYGSAATTTLTSVADQMRTAPILVVESITVDRITCEVTTAVAATTFGMGIYRDSTTRPGYPGALLLDAGTIDSSTTGVKEITISQALSPGVYWLAGVAHGGTPAFRAQSGAGFMPMGAYAESNASTAKTCWVQTGVTGALPDPHSTTLNTGGTAFKIMLRQA